MRMHTEGIFDLGKNEHMTGPTHILYHILYQIIDFVPKNTTIHISHGGRPGEMQLFFIKED